MAPMLTGGSPTRDARADSGRISAYWLWAWTGTAILVVAAGFVRAAFGHRSDDFYQVYSWLRPWLLTGINPYATLRQVNYPPLAFIVLAPLALLPSMLAAKTWAAINVALVWAVAYLAVTRLVPNRTGRETRLLMALFVAWNAVLSGFWMGQFTMFAWLCGLCAYATPERTLASGAFVGLSLIKPHVGIVAVIWALLTKRVGVVVVAAAMSVAGLLLMALRIHISPFKLVTSLVDVLLWQFGGASPHRGVTEFWVMLLRIAPPALISPGSLRLIFTVVFSAVIGAAAWIGRTRPDAGAVFLALGGLWTLATQYHMRYDMILLLPSMLLAWQWTAGRPMWRGAWWTMQIALVIDPPWAWTTLTTPRGKHPGWFQDLLFHGDRVIVLLILAFIVAHVWGDRAADVFGTTRARTA